MQAAQIMPATPWSRPTPLRKAMGKKIPAVMARQEEQFVQGAAPRGIRSRVAHLFEQMSRTSPATA